MGGESDSTWRMPDAVSGDCFGILLRVRNGRIGSDMGNGNVVADGERSRSGSQW